jgi:hypothetical protein
VESIQEGFSAFVMGFARLFLISLFIWMFGLVVLLFREMFSGRELVLRQYLQKVWRLLLTSFEWVSYAGVIGGPVLLLFSEEKLTYVMLTVAAVIMSGVWLAIRKQTGGFMSSRVRK